VRRDIGKPAETPKASPMLGLGNQLRRLIPISQKKRGESLQYPKADLSSGHAGEKLLERSHLTEQAGLG
jgi:hypothetical protein